MKKFLCLIALIAIALPGCQEIDSEVRQVIVTFTWTAPGDDGIMGQASDYDMRCALTPDSLSSNWESTTQLTNLPSPQPSGATEVFVDTLLLETESTYYFAFKTADEVPNWSGLSNIVSVFVPDTLSPSDVTDLQVELGG